MNAETPSLDDYNKAFSVFRNELCKKLGIELKSAGEVLSEIGKIQESNSKLRDALMEVVDSGKCDFHEDGCPEDDTCECKLANQINEALRGIPR